MRTYEKQAKALKKVRKELGISQGKLSQKCGYASAQNISNVERGTAPLSPRVIANVAKSHGDILIRAMVQDYISSIREAMRGYVE